MGGEGQRQISRGQVLRYGAEIESWDGQQRAACEVCLGGRASRM